MISIDWGTKVIYIPKSFLTLVQSTPTEIYELDLNIFRLALKDLEDSENGMSFLDTHRHNTEVTLAGITYARVIEIINGYTITFEDDQYAVNLIGANSNVADNVNVNQVSVRANNSAGLISSPAIEYSSFEGGVFIDVNSSTTGTIYPAGTQRSPVNNLADAILIAEFRGFSKLYFLSDYTFDASTYISNYSIYGQGLQITTFTFEIGCIVAYCEFFDANCTGLLTGIIGAYDCMINSLGSIGLLPSSQDIIIKDCLISGTTSLPSNYSGNIKVLNCWSDVPGTDVPILDMGNSTSNLLLRSYTGGVKIINNTNNNSITIDLVSGRVFIDSSVTNGNFLIRGVGLLYNSSASASVNDDGLISKEAVAITIDDLISPELQYSSFNGGITIDTINGTDSSVYPSGTSANPCKTLLNVSNIARSRGFKNIYVNGDLTLTGIPPGILVNYSFIGTGHRNSIISINDIQSTNCTFESCKLNGTFSNSSFIVVKNSEILNLYNITIDAHDCELSETIELNNTEPSNFFNCVDGVPGSGTPIIEVNDCVSLGIWGYTGGLKLTNIITPNTNVSVNFSSGRLILDSSSTQGSIIVRGVGSLAGTTNGTTINSIGLIDNSSIALSTWEEQLSGHTASNSAGAKINTIDTTTKNTIGVVLSK